MKEDGVGDEFDLFALGGNIDGTDDGGVGMQHLSRGLRDVVTATGDDGARKRAVMGVVLALFQDGVNMAIIDVR